MTKMESIEVDCPFCGAKGSYEHFASVNVTLDPELKEKVLDESLFTYSCSTCGKTAQVDIDCLYHDMQNGLFILLIPNAQDDSQLRDALEALAGMKFSFLEEDYLVRIVPSITDLKEKIFIAESELDDRVVEMMKFYLQTSLKNRNLIASDTELKFLSAETDEIIFAVIDGEGNLSHFSISMDYYYEEKNRNRFLDPETEGYLIDSKWAFDHICRMAENKLA